MWDPFVAVLANAGRVCGVSSTEEDGSSGRGINPVDGSVGSSFDLGQGLLEVGFEGVVF